jgi:replicative DNA helicase
MMFAEYVIGSISNRNNIQKVYKHQSFNQEAYRSLFLFTEEIKLWVEKTGSVKGFEGKHFSDSLLFDFDCENLDEVKTEAANFCLYLEASFEIPTDCLNIHFSGNKGFHIGVPIQCITDDYTPKMDFWKAYRSIAIEISKGFDYADSSIYEIRRIIRLENSLHPKSKLYKIPLTFSELKNKSIDEIKELAKKPRVVEKDIDLELNEGLKELYLKWINKPREEKPKAEYTSTRKADEILSLIENGVGEGGRHAALIRITATLAERGITFDFILALLKNWNKNNTPPLPDNQLESEARAVINEKTKADDKMKIYSLRDSALEYRDFVLNKESSKVNIGYPLIDKKLRGIMPGETMCILGKTSVGKSAFLQNIGLNYARSSKEPVLFFSLEMPITSVFERSVQISSGFTGYEIENGFKQSDKEVYRATEESFINYPQFYTIVKTGLDLNGIKQGIIKAEEVYKNKTGLILVDYLGLVKGKGRDIYERISEVARGMKDLAKEMNVPIIFLSQITKAFTEFTELELGAARDSGAIDEASDFILGLWKEKDNRIPEEQTNIPQMLGILKNRKGGLGKIEIKLDKRSLRVEERKLEDKVSGSNFNPNNGKDSSLDWAGKENEDLSI